MKTKYLLKTTFFVLIFAAFQSCIISTKPNIDYFKSESDQNSSAQFTSINLPLFLAKPIIRKALREDNDPDSREVMNLIRKVSKVKIMTLQNGDEKMIKDFAKNLLDNNYQDWMSIKHDGSNVNIKAQQDGNVIKKLMLTVNSGKELVFIDIRGKFTPEDITNLINKSSTN